MVGVPPSPARSTEQSQSKIPCIGKTNLIFFRSFNEKQLLTEKLKPIENESFETESQLLATNVIKQQPVVETLVEIASMKNLSGRSNKES